MRWVFAIVLVVVAGSVAAFGIWTFGREEDGDRELALAYVDVIRNDYPELRSVELEHVDGTIWRARTHWADDEPSCALLDIAKFERAGKQRYEGLDRTACPGEVVREASTTTTKSKPKPPPPPPLGPDWWTTDEASEKISHSAWLERSGLGSPLFDCIGQGRRREDRATFEDIYRKFVCTYNYAGPAHDREGRIVLETTGADTFRVVSE
jgi:hypothetical protein